MIEFLVSLVFVLGVLLASEMYTAPLPQWQGGTTLGAPADRITRALAVVIVFVGALFAAATFALAAKAFEMVLSW